MINANSIVGRTEKVAFDFYETPEWATQKVIEKLLEDGMLDKDEDILEPCCGAGAITKVLKDNDFENVRSSDIQTADYIIGKKGVDVYNIGDGQCSTILTNPPYDLMTQGEKDGGSLLGEFLRIAKKKVILLLNVYFLASKKRKELLESSHIRHMYIHSDRVTMFPFGESSPKSNGTKMFVWVVWDKEYNGEPTFSFI